MATVFGPEGVPKNYPKARPANIPLGFVPFGKHRILILRLSAGVKRVTTSAPHLGLNRQTYFISRIRHGGQNADTPCPLLLSCMRQITSCE